MGEEVTRIMIGVNESSLKGYPHPSISSKGAFEWTIKKIVRNNVSSFNLLLLHAQVPDEDGISYTLTMKHGHRGTTQHRHSGHYGHQGTTHSGHHRHRGTTQHGYSGHHGHQGTTQHEYSGHHGYRDTTQHGHSDIDNVKSYEDVDSIYASNEDFKNMKEKERVRGTHLLEYFVNKCNEIGVACQAWIKQGDPKEVILDEVKRLRPDLLVVGSRGLGPFQKVFVGTVSEFCWKHAECPVMTIKRSADETPRDPVDD